MATNEREGTRASRIAAGGACLAIWRCRADGERWRWEPGSPDWLPPDARADLAALLRHTDGASRERLQSLLGAGGEDAFRLTLPIGSGAARRWLEIGGERAPDGTLVGFAQDVTARAADLASSDDELRLHREAAADADAVSFEASLPTWRMRRIGRGIEALTGLVLMAWSASFSYLMMERLWKNPE